MPTKELIFTVALFFTRTQWKHYFPWHSILKQRAKKWALNRVNCTDCLKHSRKSKTLKSICHQMHSGWSIKQFKLSYNMCHTHMQWKKVNKRKPVSWKKPSENKNLSKGFWRNCMFQKTTLLFVRICNHEKWHLKWHTLQRDILWFLAFYSPFWSHFGLQSIFLNSCSSGTTGITHTIFFRTLYIPIKRLNSTETKHILQTKRLIRMVLFLQYLYNL